MIAFALSRKTRMRRMYSIVLTRGRAAGKRRGGTFDRYRRASFRFLDHAQTEGAVILVTWSIFTLKML
jgi:hypothetical protein